MKWLFSILATPTLLLLASAASARVQYVETMPPARHPEMVYWFWQSNTLAGSQFLHDIDEMATSSPYTIAFMTERGLDFYDYAKMHQVFVQTVRSAHEHHLKIGLQLWEFWNPLQPRTSAVSKSFTRLTADQAQALVTDGEVILDAEGSAVYSTACTNGRASHPFHSDVLKAFAFRKTRDGYYDENSLKDITPLVKIVQTDESGVKLQIETSTNLSGYTAYVMTAHYFDYPDLFNNVMSDKFREALVHYADIPFDGTALDEFGFMMVTRQRDELFRCRFYGRAFAAEFGQQTGHSLERTLFDMRFSPEGKPATRIRAINQYFEVMRQGPMRIEKAFYQLSKDLFGPKVFAGDHNTFHNYMRTDDVWRVGLNWWTLPREYGQSDENWPMPQRMGLIVTHPEPVTIDMYYGRDINGFLQKAFLEARFGGRTDYHGWNDTDGRWGINLADAKKCESINETEHKIRLLNHFDPAAPKLSVLIVFGMPALLNWFPDEAKRSPWDINGALGIEDKAQLVWRAGYPCALLPTDLIDDGQITIDAANHLVVNGHPFDCLVFLYPQYAKESTLQFLEHFIQNGGKLMIEGEAGFDFQGADIAQRWQRIAARATISGFDVNELPKLGAHTNGFTNGAFMEDGSVIFTDFESWRQNQTKRFAVRLGRHDFSGDYLGVCALKANELGEVEKFTCGGFSELKRDGKVIMSLKSPADVVITRMPSGEINSIIVGSQFNILRTSPN